MAEPDASTVPFLGVKPNVIFALGDAQKLDQGLAHLRQGDIKSLDWRGGEKTLVARFEGRPSYTVQVRPKADFLEHSCTCRRWSPARACSHVIAVTAAWYWVSQDASYGPNNPEEKARLAGMLEPHWRLAARALAARSPDSGSAQRSSSTPIAAQVRPVREAKRNWIGGGLSRDDLFSVETPLRREEKAYQSCILVDAGFEGSPRFTAVLRRGSQYSNGGDLPTRRLATHLEEADDPQEAVRDLLISGSSPVPFLIRTPDGSAVFEEVTRAATGVLRVTLDHDNVSVKADFHIREDGAEAADWDENDFAVVGTDLALGRDGTLLFLEITAPQFFVAAAPFLTGGAGSRFSDPDTTFFRRYRLPLDEFNRVMPEALLTEDEALEPEIQFNYRGQAFTPKVLSGELVLEFRKKPYQEKVYAPSVHLHAADRAQSITACFGILASIFSTNPFHALLFRENDRAAALLETLHAILPEPDCARAKQRAGSLLDSELFRPPDLRAAAEAFFEDILEGTQRFRATWIRAGETTEGKPAWAFPAASLGQALDLFIVGFLPFHNHRFPDPFLHEWGSELTEERLFACLPAIFDEAQRRGARVTVEGLTIRGGDVRIGVDVDRRPSGQHWFELRPEICLPDKDITEFALNGGFGRILRMEDGFVILDERQAEQVSALRALAGRSTGKNKGTLTIPPLAIFEWLYLRKRGIHLRLPEEERPVLESLAAFSGIPSSPLPQEVTVEPRDYQLDGYHWLAFLYQHRFGACLADDMGLGKTLQAILLLAALKEERFSVQPRAKGLPHLVVVPASLVFNWTAEIRRFAPAVTVHECTGSKRSHEYGGADVVITTYDLLRRDIARLQKEKFHVLILDEAQAVKNPKAARTRAVGKVDAAFRICLTGTPVENHIGELQTILHLSLPGLFDGIPADKRRGQAFTEQILERARPFILRRTKEAVLTQLPPKTESVVTLELTPAQRAFYMRETQSVRGEIERAYADMAPANAGVAALAALMRLRQICVCPGLVNSAQGAEAPKFQYLLETLEELREEGHSALVFSQFVRALDLIEGSLRAEGLDVVRLDGSTPLPERKRRVEHFQTGTQPQVFLISLRAGGVGLNLTRATYVFHVDPWWNPAVENQASDRAHRIGQTEKVFIQRLIMRHTVEEKIQELKAKKSALYQQLFGDDPTAAATKLTREDFAFLLDTGD